MFAYKFPPPTADESRIARESSQTLARIVREDKPLTVRVMDVEPEASLALPASAVNLLKDILEAMAAGQRVTLIPEHAELTTMQAADILNVSRPYLIKLLEKGEIPFRKVGRHRRILMEDLMAYKDKSDRQSRAAMDELVALSEELGLYDE